MRVRVLAMALIAASCSPKQDAEQTSQAAPAPAVETAPPPSIPAVIGTWSFDQSCASGDGMILAADGTASFDEWGIGTWRMEDDRSLVLDLTVQEPGMDPDPSAPHQTKTISISAPVGDHLTGALSPDGRAINAKRCASSP